MATYDVSPQRESLLGDAITLGLLSPELRHVVEDTPSPHFLEAIAEAALAPQLTERIFVHFEPVFADIAARWLLNARKNARFASILASFARILPFSPNLSQLLEKFLIESSPDSLRKSSQSRVPSLDLAAMQTASSELDLTSILLAVWRLVCFDRQTYSQLVPVTLQSLFHHHSHVVRYLAIRIFCQVYAASDFKMERLIDTFIPERQSLMADFDSSQVDYTFLSIAEHRRADDMHKSLLKAKSTTRKIDSSTRPYLVTLTPLAVAWGQAVLPRVQSPLKQSTPLVKTTTTLENLQNLASLLRGSHPILLYGLPGSGKTSLIQEAAREMSMESGLVTLHLNEQTDAKMLIGLYTTGTKPGSFEWRSGILTTAVREGRWILIEDLDRAPNEVMSTLLPLIERRELLIPTRGETVKAPSSFRIFATIRSSLGLHGQEAPPNFMGSRFWRVLNVKTLPQKELQSIVQDTFPSLSRFVPGILAVFDQLLRLAQSPASLGLGRGVAERPPSSRDLLKWCRRLDQLFAAAGLVVDSPINDTIIDQMFLEAVDCFVGSAKEERVREVLVRKIGQEMRISPERVDYFLTSHVPRLEENERQIVVGRTTLLKTRRQSRVTKSRRPFATTTHAKRLLEQIAVAVKVKEPVLLVGETGIGKTTVVQQLAESLGHKLVAVNLSQQSEVGDLLGGFKPVNVRSLAMPLKEEFDDLFLATGISRDRNERYLERIDKSLARGKWADLAKLWRQAPKMFEQILQQLENKQERDRANQMKDGQPAKRRKTESSRLQSLQDLKPRWNAFAQNLEQFEIQLSGGSGGFAFAFVEGKIVKAVRNGDWVLLDEINLASPDTLEAIADLLQSDPNETPSILLSETGEIERIKAHPEFRIFGAMNPATDVGKRDLPIGLRSRFTELYVSSPDKDVKDLVVIIKTYLKSNSSTVDRAADRVAHLYLAIKRLAEQKGLVDGANEVPHFSLRTLTRVLTYVNDVAAFYGLDRALYEGFCMGFLTLLSQQSENIVMPLILDHLFEKNLNRTRSLLRQTPKYPTDGREYVRFMDKDKERQYWILKGALDPQERVDYIRTPYVERNLLNLVRATSTRRFPILIQGPTSAGKTSMIEYLANFSGNKFVRINNHEHTDLQEYLGTYASGPDGKLKFQEGVLVQAMRQGHWIVLDELNLAPTDVLEALNRLLDDNRELLIPETQEIVRPHESFMLFATQNPPGLYGGRKVLSRAFRNRFLELHFDDIPESELGYILQKRCRNTAPSDCERIVNVYKELSRLRQTSRVFEQKDSFATLRDLFRWALREANNRDEIAVNGFMLLAERVRNEEESNAVKEVIETVFKTKIDTAALYDASSSPELNHFHDKVNSQGVVWTAAMRRLYVLLAHAIRNNEPVLLVGDTGSGKTTVCQLLAEASEKELHIVNAHQNTETGDLIGSQRPVRNRGAILDQLRRDLAEAFQALSLPGEGSLDELLHEFAALDPTKKDHLPSGLIVKIEQNHAKSKALFEWSDGSLVHAMKTGQFFLLDEISLADDSVLERLNSVLEPQRTLLLAEKGLGDPVVQAAEGFQFFATMNPGGDFGKKELSPALRNRFTEIWVPPLTSKKDILDIVSSKLSPKCRGLSNIVVDFSYWFGDNFRSSSAAAFSIRDILVWIKFINQCGSRNPMLALLHGAATVFIDTLGANPSAMIAIDPKSTRAQRRQCLDKLGELAGVAADFGPMYEVEPTLLLSDEFLSIGDFSVPRVSDIELDSGFEFAAPTTKMNAMRVVRALQMDKPILLEGNPGVGKTTLVSAIARACGQPLTRINLSDQTDLMDLFGTDIPVEGAEAGNFAWRDAPFLQAMQKGEWVLLDEMNLASQSVLEGLNACLDHRGEVYISELDQVFKRHPNFRLFAAQNPHHQGGGRKGLPSSFVNRFIVVYADVFTEEDQLCIAQKRAQHLSPETVRQIITFISALEHEIVVDRSFGSQGSPWEFNLRDTLRWLELAASGGPLISHAEVQDFLDIIVRQRFRTKYDRDQVVGIFERSFKKSYVEHSLYHNLSSVISQVGFGLLERNSLAQPTDFPNIDVIPRLAEIESLMICIQENLPCILVGPSGSGKSALLNHVAALAGRKLVVFPLNADVDTMDLVGGFEQADPLREVYACLIRLREALCSHAMSLLPKTAPEEIFNLIRLLEVSSDDSGVLEAITQSIEKVVPQIPSTAQVAGCLEAAYGLLQKSLVLLNPRFEWLDGVIVRALEAGDWLVLDNANLCSASVLDRLNSLLERPDGFLSINEHSGPNGEPRIVKPHPEFRIFLTMDPRYGDLSRAMRNRSIEIYIDQPPDHVDEYKSMITRIEARMARFQTAITLSKTDCPETSELVKLALDDLSVADTQLLERFSMAVAGPRDTESQQSHMYEALGALASYLHSPDALQIRQAIGQLLQTGSEDLCTSLVNMRYSTPSPSAARHITPKSLATVQPLHPLHNSPLIKSILKSSSDSVQWLGTAYDYYFELVASHQAFESQVKSLNIARPSLLNRLQRSSIADKVATVLADSTASASAFLTSILQDIHNFLTLNLGRMVGGSKARLLIRLVLHYWWRTYQLLVDLHFDEVRFQAHLKQGVEVFEDIISRVTEPETCQFAQTVIRRVLHDFTAGFTLTTGLSMELLWLLARPHPIEDAGSLRQITDLERLATRFDNLRWRADTPFPELTKIVIALADSYGAIRSEHVNADDLLETLATEIVSLEKRMEERNLYVRPYFAEQFESLRQTLVLRDISCQSQPAESMADLAVLSDLPTLSVMRERSATGFASRLQGLDNLLYQETTVHPWTGTVISDLLHKFDSMSQARLSALRSLESELPTLGKILARSSEPLATDHLQELNQILWQMLHDVIVSHESSLGSQLSSTFEAMTRHVQEHGVEITEEGLVTGIQVHFSSWHASYPQHLVKMMEAHFSTALLALAASKCGKQPRASFTAIAWVQFALGAIKLYTPDKVFDPHLKSQMERDFHSTLREDLARKLSVLSNFEERQTGQSSNVRCALVQEELSELGRGPDDIPVLIHRPSSNDLVRIQKELFNPVLDTIAKENVSSTHFSAVSSSEETKDQEIQLLQDNVSRLIQRLSGQFTAYQDITVPLANLLRCLQLGLSLTTNRQRCIQPKDNDLSALLAVTPFFGGGSILCQGEKSLPSRRFEFLSYVSTRRAIEGDLSLSPTLRQSVLGCFHFFYEEWSRKLDADRKAEESKNSLYHFRGSIEDEEEIDAKEFNDLFPVFTTDDSDGTPAAQSARHQLESVRDLSIRLSKVHKHIVSVSQESQHALKKFLIQIGQQVGQDAESFTLDAGNHLDNVLLPIALLNLQEKIGQFEADEAAISSFYASSNLPEVRKLVALVYDIRSHFGRLQQVDEIGHLQPIADVLGACDVILELGHSKSLAEIIPRLERLHGFLYEWQFGGYASRQYINPTLYDRATSMIVAWRRLELATWDKLFDMEVQKCEEDANSWWFIAYQAVIAGPLALLEAGQDLRKHTSLLLEELQAYFVNSMIGQFKARLDLLRQMQKHLDMVVSDYPAMSVVRNALHNFIAFYERFDTKVSEAINKGREPLQKKMKEILLLASWKDTNIAALRESAVKSHQKLFRLVRKFRSVLGQPASQVIAQGLPDSGPSESSPDNSNAIAVDIGEKAAIACQRMIPDWGDDSQTRRLMNVGKLVRTMAKTGRLPESALQAVSIVDTFVQDLLSSAAELRKETPGILTEENKDIVKHIKTRKVKLFSDTLKDVRQMGFNRNLAENTLMAQKSLAEIFARSEVLATPETSHAQNLDYHFHKLLDLAPRFREARFEHHSDLSHDTVQRSTGYLEGILLVVRQQRQILCTSFQSLASLQNSVSFVRNLATSETSGSIRLKREVSNSSQVLSWLYETVQLAAELISIHGRLGKIDNKPVMDYLNATAGRLDAFRTRQKSLTILPDAFTSTGILQLEDEIQQEFQLLQDSLEMFCNERPDLSFILQQVSRWTLITTSDIDRPYQVSLNSLNSEVVNASRLVLSAIQHFSKEAAALPTSTEDASWLVRYTDSLSTAIKSLHINTIQKAVSECLTSLATLKETTGDVGLVAQALLGVLLPVLQQYMALCQESVSQLASLYQSMSKMAYHLSKSFTDIAREGFCTPQEKSDEKSGEGGNLESGTGLGDGEGAEDISKDIQPDEDLSELAQEPGRDSKGDIEDEKDAVDMGDEEMEGEMGSAGAPEDDEEKTGSGDEDEPEEMDEEAGEVDDLDPTAVDEKMWDGEDEEEADKDQQGNAPKGQEKDGEPEAVDDTSKRDEKVQQDGENEQGEPEMDEEVGPEQEEVMPQDELNRQDQNVQEQETLALPDDMDIDAKDDGESSGAEDDLDDLSTDGGKDEEDLEVHESEAEDGEGQQDEAQQLQEVESVADTAEADQEPPEEVEMEVDKQDEEGHGPEEEVEEKENPLLESAPEKVEENNKDAAPSDVRTGGGQDQEDAQGVEDNEPQDNAAQREQGEMGENAVEEDAATGNKGRSSKMDGEPPEGSEQQEEDATESQPFRKLGDVLEQWYRNQQDIKAAQPEEDRGQPDKNEQEMAMQEFQHLQDENAPADTQALGTATEDEVKPIDDSMAIDNDMEQANNMVPVEDDEEAEEPEKVDNTDGMDTAEAEQQEKDEGRSGVATRQGAYNREDSLSPSPEEMTPIDDAEDQDVQETSTALSTTHITDTGRQLRDFSESLQQWTEFQTKTHSLSLSLTSQLRLILTPSQSTKLSGSYRTGKRLNIKKIIPYIASSYKRDKIWMRRSIPTKRAYQILLCVDDSKSMGESSSGNLALESLVMVSRALTMLEVGQVGVMGFGADVFTAHDLVEPFATHEAGARVLQNFSFDQDGTDICLLIRQTIDRFRLARQQSATRGSEDLWQLSLILSDGLTPSSAHERIRRLLREAMEERVMIVFIVMDDAGKKKGDSVLELKEAKFSKDEMGNSRVVIERYLDTFPFQYYLIVHHLEDLPGALAGLLRTWFAEVNS
ncbi:uncharacterized protein E0L32_011709 [Thyridium curvatum]|uniref:Midasin n=1 Tax=Thyridium curvatum TaxID=1093900 RepID=A0A507BG91_9PEZI|nr:uncharacterized protein E0L32_011709 [Thyridium curvatum]TPX18376.1 hypothetical protein E0L32_011709 [Thyridium curvatum]